MTAKSYGVAISMMSTDIRIKQDKKVPDGFNPVRDRSREVFRWFEPGANKKRMGDAAIGSDGYRADK